MVYLYTQKSPKHAPVFINNIIAGGVYWTRLPEKRLSMTRELAEAYVKAYSQYWELKISEFDVIVSYEED